MNPLLTLIKEQNADFIKKFFCYRMDGDKIGDHVGAQNDVQDFHRSALITLLEANCVRLRGMRQETIEDQIMKAHPGCFVSWEYDNAEKRDDDMIAIGKNRLIDEELALYGALIKKLQAN